MYLFPECKGLLGNLHTGFHDGCTSLHVYGQWTRCPLSQSFHQNSLALVFLHCTYSDWSEIESQSSFHLHFPNSYGYLSLKRNIYWPFVNFLLRTVSSLFRSLIGNFVSLMLNFCCSLCIQDINPCLRYTWQIFSVMSQAICSMFLLLSSSFSISLVTPKHTLKGFYILPQRHSHIHVYCFNYS